MHRIIRPTILNSLTPVGFVGVIFAALAVSVFFSGIATFEVVICFAMLLGFCVLWCVQAYRRITILSPDGVAVRNALGLLRRLRWSEIAHSRVYRSAGVGIARHMRGAPVRIEVFSCNSDRPRLVIPVVAYREEDVDYLLEQPEFLYAQDYNPRPR